MELIAENMRYIQMGLCKGVYHDEKHRMYVLPAKEIPYVYVFGELAQSFNMFHTYIVRFTHQPETKELQPVLLYLKLRARTAKMEEFIQGFRRAQQMVREKKRCRVMQKLQQMRRANNTEINESHIDGLFLSCGMYMSALSFSTFYRASYAVAKYYLSKNQLALSRRFAMEALQISGRTSSAEGITETKELLRKVEEKMQSEL